MSKSLKGLNSPIDQKEEIESTSKKLLNRKTKRENNNNSLESLNNFQVILANEIRCSICLKYQKFSSKCYKCSVCSSYFHLECYNLFTFTNDESDKISENNINLNNFICLRCMDEKNNNSKYNCYLCGEHDGIIKKNKDQYIHHYCNIFNIKDNHPKNSKCNNCKMKKFPVLKCYKQECKNKYHLKCALEKGIIFSLSYMRGENDEGNKKETFNEPILFFCEIHNKDIIDNYTDYIYVMTQSLNDKRDNNPINEIKNKVHNLSSINNNEKINTNNEKEKENNNSEIQNDNSNEQKNKDNNNEEIKIKENEINDSLSLNSDDNYGSNNDSKEPKEKSTPVNDYSSNKNSNDKNSAEINNIISNDNSNNNNNNNNNNNIDIINDTVTKNSNVQNDNNENNKKENLNNENMSKENINKEKSNDIINDDEVEEQIDIKMDIENDDKNKKNDTENKETRYTEKKMEEEDKEIINIDKKENENNDLNNEKENENEEYKIPEIKREEIDLFENFRKMNEDYSFPGCFYRFHGI